MWHSGPTVTRSGLWESHFNVRPAQTLITQQGPPRSIPEALENLTRGTLLPLQRKTGVVYNIIMTSHVTTVRSTSMKQQGPWNWINSRNRHQLSVNTSQKLLTASILVSIHWAPWLLVMQSLTRSQRRKVLEDIHIQDQYTGTDTGLKHWHHYGGVQCQNPFAVGLQHHVLTAKAPSGEQVSKLYVSGSFQTCAVYNHIETL